ncbi:transaldolase [Alteromonas sp. HB246098]
MMSILEQLKSVTTIVADSGDINSIKSILPIDATTNPSLILKSAKEEQYSYLLNLAIENTDDTSNIADICDRLIVNFGCEILKHIPGRISSEVDARLSFNTQASIDKGRKLISMYEEAGVSRDRVLIKLAATWQGIKAAEQLEKEGIHCNLTLLFSLPQAIACAEAGVTLISPFVGRILDWFKAKDNKDYHGKDDPGVKSVTQIYNYYKSYGYQTVVMGASFRNTEEILQLAGCDLLTISPDLIHQLSKMDGELEVKLDSSKVVAKSNADIKKLTYEEFLWQFNEDAMAVEKLSEGIRNFAKDQEALELLVKEFV